MFERGRETTDPAVVVSIYIYVCKQVWQAVYTAGVVLPKPVARCRYFHRLLKPKKLIDIGFTRLAPRMTMARTMRLYQLPDSTSTGVLCMSAFSSCTMMWVSYIP